MSDELKALAERIRGELIEIDRLVRRVLDGWEQHNRTGDELIMAGFVRATSGATPAVSQNWTLAWFAGGEAERAEFAPGGSYVCGVRRWAGE